MTEFEAIRLAQPAAVLFAAGYLLVTRRRSPRAARLGLAGAGLLGLYEVAVFAGGWQALIERFPADGPTTTVWVSTAAVMTAYALLVWAVPANRPPVDPGE